MKKTKLTAALLSAVLACACTLTAFPQASAAEYAARKSRVSVHDPSVIRDGQTGMYYVFGSHIDAAKSSDLQSWQTFTNGYAATNNKLFGNLSQNLQKPFAWAGENLEDCKGGFAVWAPDVVWNPDYVNGDGSKGAYLMYFCTSSTYMRSVIAFAAAQNIEGPYTCVDTLIYSGFTNNDSYATSSTKNVNRKYTSTNIPALVSAGQVTMNSQWFNKDNFNNQLFPNAIDPTIYYDTDGRMYMCYGSWSGGIFTLEIDKATGRCIHPKTGTTADGRMVDSYFGTKISGGYGKSGEGPFIEYNAETGFYYLFVTYGGLTSTGGYNMRVGRSRSPLGPFTDAAGRNMVLDPNPNLNAIGLKLMTNYKFSSLQKAYMAPGHNSVLHDSDGKWYLVNHTRFDDGAEFHEVRVHAMHFNAAGWPVVMPYEYSGEDWGVHGFAFSDIAGDYEFINHGTGTDGTITTASKITLTEDGMISGAVSGTWKEDAVTGQAVIQIGKVKYKGYFVPQYDETGTGKRVMTFTAAGNDNQTIWGVQTVPFTGKELSLNGNYYGSAQLVYDKNAVADSSGGLHIAGTKLLSNVSYKIENVNSGKLLTADAETGAIAQYDPRGCKSGDPDQDFRITDLGNGWCRLTTMFDESKCIAVKTATAENGADLEVQTFTGADNQLFRLVPSGSYFGIVSKCSDGGAGLDVYEWSTENGGVVKQWEFWDGDCQLWQVRPAHGMITEPDTVSVQLRNVGSGLYVAYGENGMVQQETPVSWILQSEEGGPRWMLMDGGGRAVTVRSGENGAELTMEQASGADSQLFEVWTRPDGSYSLLSKMSGGTACLDVYEVSSEPGAKVCQWEYHDGDGQRFVLIPSEKPETFEPETTTTTTTTATETTSSEPEIQPMKGDVDCSGEVNVADCVMLARYLAEDKEVKISAQGLVNAETTGDTKLTAEDNARIMEHIAGLTAL